jgi:hypothetical protein
MFSPLKLPILHPSPERLQEGPTTLGCMPDCRPASLFRVINQALQAMLTHLYATDTRGLLLRSLSPNTLPRAN